jgi:hypothetical protein
VVEQGAEDRDPITCPRARRKQAVSETKHLNQCDLIGYASAKVLEVTEVLEVLGRIVLSTLTRQSTSVRQRLLEVPPLRIGWRGVW